MDGLNRKGEEDGWCIRHLEHVADRHIFPASCFLFVFPLLLFLVTQFGIGELGVEVMGRVAWERKVLVRIKGETVREFQHFGLCCCMHQGFARFDRLHVLHT